MDIRDDQVTCTRSVRTGQSYIALLTSSLSFFISTVSSWQCLVYCHLAVFSLSTTCNRLNIPWLLNDMIRFTNLEKMEMLLL